MVEEIDAPEFEWAVVHIGEMVDIADPSVRSPETDGDSDSDPSSIHWRRLRMVKAVEKHLKKKEGLKWYEIAGSYLDHGKASN